MLHVPAATLIWSLVCGVLFSISIYWIWNIDIYWHINMLWMSTMNINHLQVFCGELNKFRYNTLKYYFAVWKLLLIDEIITMLLENELSISYRIRKIFCSICMWCTDTRNWIRHIFLIYMVCHSFRLSCSGRHRIKHKIGH